MESKYWGKDQGAHQTRVKNGDILYNTSESVESNEAAVTISSRVRALTSLIAVRADAYEALTIPPSAWELSFSKSRDGIRR